MDLDTHCPVAAGGGQFPLCMSALRKDQPCGGATEGLAPVQQAFEGSHRARRHGIAGKGGEFPDAAGMDMDALAGADPCRFAEERRLSVIAFHEMHFRDPEDRQNQAGKARAAADIQKTAGCGAEKGKELGTVEDMAAPGIPEGGRTHQVETMLPAPQKFEMCGKSRPCFT